MKNHKEGNLSVLLNINFEPDSFTKCIYLPFPYTKLPQLRAGKGLSLYIALC